jgi:hypothetical protein
MCWRIFGGWARRLPTSGGLWAWTRAGVGRELGRNGSGRHGTKNPLGTDRRGWVPGRVSQKKAEPRRSRPKPRKLGVDDGLLRTIRQAPRSVSERTVKSVPADHPRRRPSRKGRSDRCGFGSVASAEDDLERTGLAGVGEHIVGVHDLVEVEPVGHEAFRVDLLAVNSFSSVGVE